MLLTAGCWLLAAAVSAVAAAVVAALFNRWRFEIESPNRRFFLAFRPIHVSQV